MICLMCVCVCPSRRGFCDVGHKRQLRQGSDGSRPVLTKPQHDQETGCIGGASCCRTMQVVLILRNPVKTQQTVMQVCSVLQGCTAEHFWWGAPGGHHGLRRYGSSVPDEAPGPGSDAHQAALLDSDTLQQVCVHGCRHHGEKIRHKYPCPTLLKAKI